MATQKRKNMFYLVLLSFLFICRSRCAAAQPLCRSSERTALLKFKGSFVSDPSCSVDSSKLASWVIESGRDNCCSWDGVECSNQTSHVIGLELGGSCLYGSIESNSSLFQLIHLQKLILSGNNFKFSQIPATIGQLSGLKYLDLSASSFSGQIPSAISRLSHLSFLDLSNNFDESTGELFLELKNPDLRNLILNLTSLETLRLSRVNISSTVPDVISNFTSLKFLYIGQSGLRGNIPEKIFQLPNLQHLILPYNPELYGNLPEFNLSSPLERLWLENTGFSGELPSSIGNLNSLTWLMLRGCNFSGTIPPTIGNLTNLQTLDLAINNFSGQIPSSLEHLTQLDFLQLSYNNFRDATLSWVGKQNKLTYLGLSGINLSGTLLPAVGNLTNLVNLFLGENLLSGDLPSWLGNFTQLTKLHLYGNKLKGSIPDSFSQLMSLENLYLQYNYLSGTVDLSMFMKFENLTVLHVTANKLTVLTDQITSPNATHPKFKLLGLGSCNLTQIPAFLKHQNEIEVLELGENNIQGQIPKWMWNMSIENLKVLNLSHNSLTGVEEVRDALPWVHLYVLDLSNNRLQEAFSFLPAICNLSSLVALDLSSNSMSGVLPPCIGNFSSLDILNFRQNMFHGSIPDSFRNGSKLRFIDFSQNQLQGQVPRSLVNCEILEIVDLSNNLLTDVFPFWLGKLPMLRLLVLRSNQFHGAIEGPVTNREFPVLRIVDLSRNNFSGNLPLKYFTNWKGMEIFNRGSSTYRNTFQSFSFDYAWALEFFYSTTITIKGSVRNYSRIQEVFTSIDLSDNKFVGEMSDFIGFLKGLQSLNLSHNVLTGHIPSSLGNMERLESLDLSHNKLSGEIPQQLSQLTFLAIFDLSHNNLSGRIPQGNQLNNVDNSSYVGNVGLCGQPLSKKCGDLEESPSPISTEGQESFFQFGWKIVLIGYGFGVVVGVFVGNYIITRNQEWFMRTFKFRKEKKQ